MITSKLLESPVANISKQCITDSICSGRPPWYARPFPTSVDAEAPRAAEQTAP